MYGNADAMPYPRDPDAVRRRLAAQLAQPVRFVEQIEAMYASGVRTFVEVGAGSVLSELIDRILGAREHRAIHLDRKGRHGLTSLQDALGPTGGRGRLDELLRPLGRSTRRPSKRPRRSQAMSIPVSGVNQGKPYPPAGGAKELPPPNAPRPVEPPAPRVPLAAARARRRGRRSRLPARSMETPSAPPRRETDGEWLRAYQEAQRQTAEAHAAYQRAMADSHMAFLRTAETSFAGLSALLGGQPVATAPSTIFQQPAEAVVVPAVVASPVVAPASVAPASTPIVEHMRALQDAPAPHLTNGHARPAAPVAPEPPRAALEPAAAAVDLEALMMSVVADKTGYPAEMLGGAHGPGGGPGDRLDQAGRDPGGLPRARAGAARGGAPPSWGGCARWGRSSSTCAPCRAPPPRIRRTATPGRRRRSRRSRRGPRASLRRRPSISRRC